MTLTDADIGEFQVLWKQETGQDISAETARAYAEDVLGLVALAAEPLSKLTEEKPP